MKVSVYWLNQATGKHTATIRKRISNLIPDAKGKFDSVVALEAIYCGLAESPTGEFISTPEAVRQLTIAKKEEIDLEMEIKRGLRLPIEDCIAVNNQIFQSITGTLKAHQGRSLTEEHINEIFDSLREGTAKMLNGHENTGREKRVQSSVVSTQP